MGLGRLIHQLVYQIAQKDHVGPGEAMKRIAREVGYSASTVYRWREGKAQPPPEARERLARLGRQYGMDRAWGVALLRDKLPLVDELWGPPQVQTVLSNLPPPGYTRFVGKRREQELKELLNLLSPERATTPIYVEGFAGIGKTTLVLHAAYLCWSVSVGKDYNPNVPTFDAIVFFSARQRLLTPAGIVESRRPGSVIRQLYREIAKALNWPGITRGSQNEARERALKALGQGRTLLIIDNLETVQGRDRDEVIEFINNLPYGVKTVITTRERMAGNIRLSELDEDEAVELLLAEAADKGVNLTPKDASFIYRRLGGIPAALIYTVVRMAITGDSAQEAVRQAAAPQGDLARYSFEQSVAPIRGQPAYSLLLAAAMFPKRPLEEAVAATAGVSGAFEEGLGELSRLYWIERKEGRCRMLPLTREYALEELRAQPEFEAAARRRWVDWYIQWVRRWGGEDERDYHIKFKRIAEEWENIVAVLDWCMQNEWYDEARAIWLNVHRAARLEGHWDDLLSVLDWLIEAAVQRGDAGTQARALTQKARLLYLMGRQQEARQCAEQAWAAARGRPLERASAARILGSLLMREGKVSDAVGWLEEGLRILEESPADDPDRKRLRAAILSHLGECRIRQGDLEGAEEALREAVREADAVGWERSALISRIRLGELALEAGRPEEASQRLEGALKDAQRIGDKELEAFCARAMARLARRRGDLKGARELAQRAQALFAEMGMEWEAEEQSQHLEELDGLIRQAIMAELSFPKSEFEDVPGWDQLEPQLRE